MLISKVTNLTRASETSPIVWSTEDQLISRLKLTWLAAERDDLSEFFNEQGVVPVLRLLPREEHLVQEALVYSYNTATFQYSQNITF
jgi:hypothetical protein